MITERIILNQLVDSTKSIAIWLLWYFLHLFENIKQCLLIFFRGFIFFTNIIKNFIFAYLDSSLDLLDALGDIYPILNKITPFNMEELIELILATILVVSIVIKKFGYAVFIGMKMFKKFISKTIYISLKSTNKITIQDTSKSAVQIKQQGNKSTIKINFKSNKQTKAKYNAINNSNMKNYKSISKLETQNTSVTNIIQKRLNAFFIRLCKSVPGYWFNNKYNYKENIKILKKSLSKLRKRKKKKKHIFLST